MELIRYPVHRALTRPQMFAGVTMTYFIITGVVSAQAFIIFKSLWILPVPFIMHAIGYFACLREPRVFDLWLTKVSMCPRVRNFKRWGCNSYTA
jgi:type IV secretion system protein VirB3